LEDFSFDEPRTKQYLEFLKNFNLDNKKSLLVVPAVDKTLVLSSRNIPKAQGCCGSDLNTYMILNADRLLILESSLKKVEDTLK
jgi:large subunit ribosomal protein L4